MDNFYFFNHRKISHIMIMLDYFKRILGKLDTLSTCLALDLASHVLDVPSNECSSIER